MGCSRLYKMNPLPSSSRPLLTCRSEPGHPQSFGPTSSTTIKVSGPLRRAPRLGDVDPRVPSKIANDLLDMLDESGMPPGLDTSYRS